MFILYINIMFDLLNILFKKPMRYIDIYILQYFSALFSKLLFLYLGHFNDSYM